MAVNDLYVMPLKDNFLRLVKSGVASRRVLEIVHFRCLLLLHGYFLLDKKVPPHWSRGSNAQTC